MKSLTKFLTEAKNSNIKTLNELLVNVQDKKISGNKDILSEYYENLNKFCANTKFLKNVKLGEYTYISELDNDLNKDFWNKRIGIAIFSKAKTLVGFMSAYGCLYINPRYNMFYDMFSNDEDTKYFVSEQYLNDLIDEIHDHLFDPDSDESLIWWLENIRTSNSILLSIVNL